MRWLIAYLKKTLDAQSRLLLRNTSWVLGSSIVRSGLVFVRSIVVARCLGLELYGVYALIAAFVVMLQDFFNLNIGQAFIKYGAEFRAEHRVDKVAALIKGCFYATLITALLSLCVTWAVVEWAYSFILDEPGYALYVLLFALADVATFFDPMGKSVLRLYYKFKINSIIQTLTTVVEVALLCTVVILSPKNLHAFFIAIVAVRLTNLAINLSVVYYELRHEIGPYLGGRLALIADRRREIARFVVGNSLSKTLLTAINQGDTFLVGSLCGPAHAGFYNIAKRMGNMIATVSDPFMMSIYPQLSNLVAEKKAHEIRVMLLRILRTAALPAVAVVVAVQFLNGWLVNLLYGTEYQPAADVLRITIITYLVAAVFFWNQSIMLSLGMIRFRFFVYLFVLAVGLLLAHLIVPGGQAVGMAWTVLAVKATIIFIFTAVAFRKLNTLARDGRPAGAAGGQS